MKNYRHYLSFIWRAAAWLLIFPILFYQKLISPYTPSSCRFTPSCFAYARTYQRFFAWRLAHFAL